MTAATELVLRVRTHADRPGEATMSLHAVDGPARTGLMFSDPLTLAAADRWAESLAGRHGWRVEREAVPAPGEVCGAADDR